MHWSDSTSWMISCSHKENQQIYKKLMQVSLSQKRNTSKLCAIGLSIFSVIAQRSSRKNSGVFYACIGDESKVWSSCLNDFIFTKHCWSHLLLFSSSFQYFSFEKWNFDISLNLFGIPSISSRNLTRVSHMIINSKNICYSK